MNAVQEIEIPVQFPKKLMPLFKRSRYKVLYGGRGGAKSWNIARALLLIGMERPIRVLCTREFQNSIDESVHKLLKDQISLLGLNADYDIQQRKIYGPVFYDDDGNEIGRTEFSFAGLRHNAHGLRSYEGVDICWVEEAVNVSKASWETLIPTIRKEGSEIWISFNPELETDYTYQTFVLKPPSSSILINVNWRDNPWFPAPLRQEKDDLRAKDEDAYLTVWEGQTRKVLEGAVFAKELRKLYVDNRVTVVPYDKLSPVSTFWDLGRRDMTSIWFIQRVGLQWRVLKFIEDHGHAIDHYIKVLKDQEYVYDTIWLPHDGKHKTIHHPLSIREQLQKAFPSIDVNVLDQFPLEMQINAARLAMNSTWFDADKCADGLQSLTHYQYEVDPETKERSNKPLHDWASHGASAFMTFAMSIEEDRRPKQITLPARAPRAPVRAGNSGGWMSRMKP